MIEADSARRFDVVVMGEVLIELSTTDGLTNGARVRLGFSGDALNAAAASAAAGARTALLTRVADDQMGAEILAHLARLGVSTELVQTVPGQHGVYFSHCDPTGAREFVYARRGSAASQLGPADVRAARLDRAGVVVTSGVTGALSASAAEAVRLAATSARHFVYDPNFRPRLTTAAEAKRLLLDVTAHAALVTPSYPAETAALLGTTNPHEAITLLRDSGAAAVVITRGADGVLVDDGAVLHDLPAVLAPLVVDQTGAGDCLVGTVAARIALGDKLHDAVRLATAVAALSVGGPGGTGHLATMAETRALLAAHDGNRKTVP